MSVSASLAQPQLPVELELRLRAMAQRWRYTDDDLAEILNLARANPQAWLRAVALDERRQQEFRRGGLIPWQRPIELRDFARRDDWLISGRWRISRVQLHPGIWRYTLWDFSRDELLVATAERAQALLDHINAVRVA